jgi:hypothetical protein
MALIGLLRVRGPLTATQAGKILGESSGTCSFHFRQLAKYGLVEEDGGGIGREKPWRATTTSTDWDPVGDTPESVAAAGLLSEVLAETYFARVMRWLETRERAPREWREAAFIGDRILWLTPGELAELDRETQALADKYFERITRPELRPEGARAVSFLGIAFPDVMLGGEG